MADAPPEGARPQVHNAGCAMKPPGQSVGTDSKIDSLAQKNVLTLAQAAGAACETAQDSLQMDRTVLVRTSINRPAIRGRDNSRSPVLRRSNLRVVSW